MGYPQYGHKNITAWFWYIFELKEQQIPGRSCISGDYKKTQVKLVDD